MMNLASSVRISGAWARVLTDWLDGEALAGDEMRQEIARYTPDAIVPWSTWTRLLEAAAKLRYNKFAIGLQIGSLITPQHMGLIGYLLISSDSTGRAIDVFKRFVSLSNGLGLFTVHQSDDQIELQWPCDAMDNPGVALAHEVEFAAIKTLYRRHVGDIPSSAHYCFQHRVDASAIPAYEEFFGCQVSFGDSRRRIRFPATFLAEPTRQSDPALFQLLERQALTELETKKTDVPPLEYEVQKLMMTLLPKGEATIERVAALLNQVPRTLQRRLADAGLSWRSLRERTREKLAREYLADASLSLAEIAMRLGYAEQSVFTRAFQRWTGESPLSFRSRAGKP